MKATVYTMTTCVYCDEAKKLLESHNIDYDEVIVNETISIHDFIAKFPNTRSVPVVTLEDKNIFGYNALMEELSNV